MRYEWNQFSGLLVAILFVLILPGLRSGAAVVLSGNESKIDLVPGTATVIPASLTLIERSIP